MRDFEQRKDIGNFTYENEVAGSRREGIEIVEAKVCVITNNRKYILEQSFPDGTRKMYRFDCYCALVNHFDIIYESDCAYDLWDSDGAEQERYADALALLLTNYNDGENKFIGEILRAFAKGENK